MALFKRFPTPPTIIHDSRARETPCDLPPSTLSPEAQEELLMKCVQRCRALADACGSLPTRARRGCLLLGGVLSPSETPPHLPPDVIITFMALAMDANCGTGCSQGSRRPTWTLRCSN